MRNVILVLLTIAFILMSGCSSSDDNQEVTLTQAEINDLIFLREE
jgi:uncharacterized protein YceK